jgi:hypothetical protein
VADARAHRHRHAHQRREPFDDRQPQPLALVRRERTLALGLEELVEDARQTGLGDADPGVPHLQQQAAGARPAADENVAVVGVADRIADQVAQDALELQRVGMCDQRVAAGRQHQPLLERDRLKVLAQAREQITQPHRRRLDLDAAGVDARDVEQLAEQALERVHRLVDAVRKRRDLGSVRALAQRIGDQPHYVQRLAQVVAGGGKNWVFARLAASAARRAASASAFSTRSCAASSSGRAVSEIAWPGAWP